MLSRCGNGDPTAIQFSSLFMSINIADIAIKCYSNNKYSIFSYHTFDVSEWNRLINSQLSFDTDCTTIFQNVT